MKQRFLNLLKKPVIRNIALLASGGLMAQLLTFGSMPVITRLFLPEDLGQLGAFLSILSITVGIAALSYPIAIVLPKKDENARSLVQLSLLICIGACILTAILLFIFNEELTNLFNLQSISSYTFIIPLAMFGNVIFIIGGQWMVRKSLFRTQAVTLFVNAIFVNSAKIVAGYLNPIAIWLILITVTSFFLQAAVFFFSAKKIDNNIKLAQFSMASLKKMAKKYIDFPLYRAPEQLLNALTAGLPVLMLASQFSAASAGFYTLAISALNAPIMLFKKSVGDVIYPRLSRAVNKNEKLTPMLYKSTLGLVGISLPVLAVIVMFGPDIFSFIFGNSWRNSGEYAIWLISWLLMMLINRPSVAIFPVLSIQGVLLVYSIISISIRIGVLWASFVIYNDPLVTVMFFSLVSVLLNIALILMAIFYSLRHDKKLSKTSAA
ncbi:MAG: hypothetical protein COB24_00060 [Hyphomicrobiales bacterium]|nr:MAG: hypothetical protein COB24_00060 [Hyphomicrobiales bacterium]